MRNRRLSSGRGYRADDAWPTTIWTQTVSSLQGAMTYWPATTGPDGRPHVAPVLGIWLDGAIHACAIHACAIHACAIHACAIHACAIHACARRATRKARDLARKPVASFGCNRLSGGLDLIVTKADAVQVDENTTLQSIADCYEANYGSKGRYTVFDGAFSGAGGEALVYKVAPSMVFGFRKGASSSQTRWRFLREQAHLLSIAEFSAVNLT